ncbi:MAG: hypothetical protein U5J63_13805 [Fodinibius sp.]|nr:hypothetical protein [Fodinibius sp.]
MKRIVISIATLLWALLLLGACTSENSESTAENTSDNEHNELREAPNFEVETIKGDTVSLHKDGRQQTAGGLFYRLLVSSVR